MESSAGRHHFAAPRGTGRWGGARRVVVVAWMALPVAALAGPEWLAPSLPQAFQRPASRTPC